MAAAARVLRPGRVAVPERRRQAVRPLDGARRGAGGPVAPAAAEHHSLDQVDRDRPGRRPAPPPGLTRDLAVGHYKPINSERFLNDCHEFVFHFTPAGRHAARSAGARRALSGSVERRRAGGPAPTASAAAATPGSSPTRRFSGATATGRIRRRSRRGCPSSACGCTACRASELAMDPFTGAREHGGRLRAARRQLRRRGYRRDRTWKKRSSASRAVATARAARARNGADEEGGAAEPRRRRGRPR